MKEAPVESTLKLEVRSVRQLLDHESTPLIEPRIHPDVAEVLWTDALQHASSQQFRIEIAAPVVDAGQEEEVKNAVRYHYAWETEKASEEIEETLRDGRKSLVVGLIVVSLLLALAEAILVFGSGRFLTAISESLIIFAWVAIWSPAEQLLYAHIPIRRRRKLAQKLSEAKVTLSASITR